MSNEMGFQKRGGLGKNMDIVLNRPVGIIC